MSSRNPYQSPASDAPAPQGIDDDRPVTWFVLPVWRTIVAILFTPIGIVLAWGVMHIGNVPIAFALVPALLGSFAATILGIVLIFMEMGWLL